VNNFKFDPRCNRGQRFLRRFYGHGNDSGSAGLVPRSRCLFDLTEDANDLASKILVLGKYRGRLNFIFCLHLQLRISKIRSQHVFAKDVLCGPLRTPHSPTSRILDPFQIWVLTLSLNRKGCVMPLPHLGTGVEQLSSHGQKTGNAAAAEDAKVSGPNFT
jgi:hypothetical protein